MNLGRKYANVVNGLVTKVTVEDLSASVVQELINRSHDGEVFILGRFLGFSPEGKTIADALLHREVSMLIYAEDIFQLGGSHLEQYAPETGFPKIKWLPNRKKAAAVYS